MAAGLIVDDNRWDDEEQQTAAAAAAEADYLAELKHRHTCGSGPATLAAPRIRSRKRAQAGQSCSDWPKQSGQ